MKILDKIIEFIALKAINTQLEFDPFEALSVNYGRNRFIKSSPERFSQDLHGLSFKKVS
jgi:phosphoglucomutase